MAAVSLKTVVDFVADIVSEVVGDVVAERGATGGGCASPDGGFQPSSASHAQNASGARTGIDASHRHRHRHRQSPPASMFRRRRQDWKHTPTPIGVNRSRRGG
jgi:hypothetical protein